MEFLASEARSISGHQVLSLFSLNQIKSWKELKVHSLGSQSLCLCLTTNTVSFQADLVRGDLGRAVVWEADRASLFSPLNPVRGHGRLFFPDL